MSAKAKQIKRSKKQQPVMASTEMNEARVMAWATYLAIDNLALSIKDLAPKAGFKSARSMLSAAYQYYGGDLPDDFSIEAERSDFINDIRHALFSTKDWNIIAAPGCWGDALLWVMSHVQDCQEVNHV